MLRGWYYPPASTYKSPKLHGVSSYKFIRSQLPKNRFNMSDAHLHQIPLSDTLEEAWLTRIRHTGSILEYKKSDLRSDVRDFLMESATRCHYRDGHKSRVPVESLISVRNCIPDDDKEDLANFCWRARRLFEVPRLDNDLEPLASNKVLSDMDLSLVIKRSEHRLIRDALFSGELRREREQDLVVGWNMCVI